MKTITCKLTDTAIRKCNARRIYRDTVQPGLALHCRKRDKTFFAYGNVKGQFVTGKTHTVNGKEYPVPVRYNRSIGVYPDLTLEDARAIAGEKRRLARSGIHPFQAEVAFVSTTKGPQSVSGETFTDWAVRTIDQLRKGILGKKELYIRRMEQAAERITDLHHLPVDQVTVPAVYTAAEKVERVHGVGVRDQSIQRLSTLWKDGIKMGDVLPENPFKAVKAKGQSVRTEKLQRHQIKDFWAATEKLAEESHGISYLTLLRISQLSAARIKMLQAARRDEIDLDAMVWHIPGSRIKSSGWDANWTYDLPISPLMASVLRRQMDYVDSLTITDSRRHYLFPAKTARSKDPFITIPYSRLNKWKEENGITITFHDGRRTVYELLGPDETGVEDATIEMLLCHTKGGVAKHYNQYQKMAEKVRAINVLSKIFEEEIYGKGNDNVIAINQ